MKGYENVVSTRKKETRGEIENRVGLRDTRMRRALDGGTAREVVAW